MASLFHVIEFGNEEDPKSRGPHVVQEERIRRTQGSDIDVEVMWKVINSKGDVAESFFPGTTLFHGTKKACGEFKDKLKRNREVAEVNNKETRTRKKSAKLLEANDDEGLLYEVNLNLNGPPKKKSKKTAPETTTTDDAYRSEVNTHDQEYSEGKLRRMQDFRKQGVHC